LRFLFFQECARKADSPEGTRENASESQSGKAVEKLLGLLQPLYTPVLHSVPLFTATKAIMGHFMTVSAMRLLGLLLITDLFKFNKIPVLDPLSLCDNVDVRAKNEHENVNENIVHTCQSSEEIFYLHDLPRMLHHTVFISI